jgi:hypothetical protein
LVVRGVEKCPIKKSVSSHTRGVPPTFSLSFDPMDSSPADKVHCHEYISDKEECERRGLDLSRDKSPVHRGAPCNQPPRWVLSVDQGRTKAYWCDWCKSKGEAFVDFYNTGPGNKHKRNRLKPMGRT